MLKLNEYLNNPCRKSSIPYWKAKNIKIPAHIKILHQEDFKNNGYIKIDRFFRLIHHLDLPLIDETNIEDINFDFDKENIVTLFNEAYALEQIKVNTTDIKNWMSHPVFSSSLWIKIVQNNEMIACGIAEFDADIKEGIIEWVAVLPKYQHKGWGTKIVFALLKRLSNMADFVTVSGRIENITNPLDLYRKCGFEGNDIWNICYKEDNAMDVD